ATLLIGNDNAQNNLRYLLDGYQLIPGIIQSIPMQNEVKLSSYNKILLDADLNEKNLQEEILKLEITKDKSIDLNNLQGLYQKFSANSFSYNRNQSKRQIIKGVGVDGSGSHPIDYPKEERAINLIQEVAEDKGKWNAMPGNGDEILKESVKNTCFWQASNISQFPIGTPVEVCSAVIELLSPIADSRTASTHVDFKDVMTGKEFINRRREITGLRYFLDGNVPDIPNKNTIIKGIRDFETQRFIRFGKNGTITDRLAEAKPQCPIYLVTDVDTANNKIKTSSGTTGASSKSGIVKFQLTYTSGSLPADYKLIDTDLRDRSRFITALMGLAPSADNEEGEPSALDEDALEELAEHAQGIMLAPKLPPVTLLGSVDVEGLPNFKVGSLSSLVGHYLSGYEPLAPWPEVQPDPNVRDNIRLTGEAELNQFATGKKNDEDDEHA
ncbi:MAG: hypothetical protein EBS19_13975, partial [Spirochaetia bacterium]|nr:hypothetical protein [Spirochaetia bacterium]